MKLDYVADKPLEAFLAMVDSEICIDEFIEMISEQHQIKHNSNLHWKKFNDNGDGVAYRLESEKGKPIIELMQIGSGKGKYFYFDKPDFSVPDSAESKRYLDFHEFLRGLVEAQASLGYCI